MSFRPMFQTPPRPRRFMKNIRWLETSAADHPANLEEGFMVMKTAGAGTIDTLAAGLEHEARLMQTEDTMLKSILTYDWTDVAPEVQEAAAQLQEFLRKAADDPDNDGDEDHCPDHPDAPIVDGKCSVCGRKVDDSDHDAGSGNTPMGKAAPAADATPDGPAHTHINKHMHAHDNGLVHDHAHLHEPGDPDHDSAYHENSADGTSEHAAPMEKVSAVSNSSKLSAKLVARILGRTASAARSMSNVQKAEFSPEDALLKAIQAAWPDFCGRAATAAQSGETADVRKQAMLKAASGFISDVAEMYGVARWEFGRAPVAKADYSDEERAALAKKGRAIPQKNDDGEIVGGSYPIDNQEDLHKAIQAYGRNPTPTVKGHIKKMAKALGKTDMLPENW